MQSHEEMHQEALTLLVEMIDTTERVATCPDELNIDIVKLTESLDKRMSELTDIMPYMRLMEGVQSMTDDEEWKARKLNALIVDRMKELESRIRSCVDFLGRRKAQVEQELIATRQSKKAVRAYRFTG